MGKQGEVVKDNEQIINVGDDGVHTLSSEGVTSGIDFSGYHVISNKHKDKHLMYGMALGPRNMEFRRAEAEKEGMRFEPCVGLDCPHPHA